VGIDPFPRDAELGQNWRQGIPLKPSRFVEFASIHHDLTASIVGVNTDHNLTRKGPSLASEVADIVDQYARLLAHLSGGTLLKCFPRL
jgi:hypothetical protein